MLSKNEENNHYSPLPTFRFAITHVRFCLYQFKLCEFFLSKWIHRWNREWLAFPNFCMIINQKRFGPNWFETCVFMHCANFHWILLLNWIINRSTTMKSESCLSSVNWIRFFVCSTDWLLHSISSKITNWTLARVSTERNREKTKIPIRWCSSVVVED